MALGSGASCSTLERNWPGDLGSSSGDTSRVMLLVISRLVGAEEPCPILRKIGPPRAKPGSMQVVASPPDTVTVFRFRRVEVRLTRSDRAPGAGAVEVQREAERRHGAARQLVPFPVEQQAAVVIVACRSW